MDVLDAIVVVGCLGTMSIFPGAVLCWCLSFGRVLVKQTQDNSKKLLLNAFGKQPRYVWLYRDGAEVQVPLDRLQKGDVIVVNTGEVVPVDGHVVEGMAMIDQHALTGESTPAEKGVGDRVFASTLMVAGKVFVSVETSGSETASAKISQILNDTAGYKLTSQHKGERLADKAVIPTLARRRARDGHDGARRRGRGAQQRLRHRHPHGRAAGDAQLAGPVRRQGHPGQGRPGARADERGRHRPVRQDRHADPRAARGRPDHRRPTASTPDADPPLRGGRRAEVPPPDRPGDPAQGPGAGPRPAADRRHAVQGRLRHHGPDRGPHRPRRQQAVHGDRRGSSCRREVREALDEAHREGHTMVMVGVDDRLGGAIELQASVRPEVREIIQGLRERGIKHIAIISGDHEAPTRKLAESLGMDRYFAQVLPADKADYVEKLQKEGRKVCFVGDGINDSIALKKAERVDLAAGRVVDRDRHGPHRLPGGGAGEALRPARHRPRPRPQREAELVDDPGARTSPASSASSRWASGSWRRCVTNNVAALAALANGMLPAPQGRPDRGRTPAQAGDDPKPCDGKKRCTSGRLRRPIDAPMREAISTEFSRRRHEIPVPAELHWHAEKPQFTIRSKLLSFIVQFTHDLIVVDAELTLAAKMLATKRTGKPP